MSLAELLGREEERLGLTPLANKIDIAHTSLRKIIEGDYKREIETFIKIGRYFNMPLWKVMELAGYDLGLGRDEIASRVASIVRAVPEYGPLFDQLASLDPRNLEAVVVHLTAILDAQVRLSGHSAGR